MSTLCPPWHSWAAHTHFKRLWSWADLRHTPSVPAAPLHQRRPLSPSGQHVGSRLTRRRLPVCMPAGDRWWHRQTSRNAAEPRLLGCLPSWIDVPLSDTDPSTYAASSIEPRNEPQISAPLRVAHSLLPTRAAQLVRLAPIVRTARPRAHSARREVPVPVRASRRRRSATHALRGTTAWVARRPAAEGRLTTRWWVRLCRRRAGRAPQTL